MVNPDMRKVEKLPRPQFIQLFFFAKVCAPFSKWPINSTPPKPDPNPIVQTAAHARLSIHQFDKMAAGAPDQQLPLKHARTNIEIVIKRNVIDLNVLRLFSDHSEGCSFSEII